MLMEAAKRRVAERDRRLALYPSLWRLYRAVQRSGTTSEDCICDVCRAADSVRALAGQDQRARMIITLPTLTCQRCQHTWTPRQATVTICPKCKSRYWNKPKGEK